MTHAVRLHRCRGGRKESSNPGPPNSHGMVTASSRANDSVCERDLPFPASTAALKSAFNAVAVRAPSFEDILLYPKSVVRRPSWNRWKKVCCCRDGYNCGELTQSIKQSCGGRFMFEFSATATPLPRCHSPPFLNWFVFRSPTMRFTVVVVVAFLVCAAATAGKQTHVPLTVPGKHH